MEQSPVSPHEAIACWSLFDWKARLIVDRSRYLKFACVQASKFLSQGRDLVLRDRRVCCADEDCTRKLDELVSAADAIEAAILLVPRADGDGMLLVRLMGLTQSDNVALLCQVTGRDFQMRYVGLDQAFDLSRTELKIGCGLLNGETAEEMADRFCVSVQTVRCHIKHIYAKLRVCSREQLFRAAAPFRVL